MTKRSYLILSSVLLAGLLAALLPLLLNRVEPPPPIVARHNDGGSSTLLPGSPPLLRSDRTDCRGQLVTACDTGQTGPDCSIPCPSAGGSCDWSQYCHSDGNLHGFSVVGTEIFPIDRTQSEEHIATTVRQGIAAHALSLGFEKPISPDELELELERAPLFRTSSGLLTTYIFVQSYRDFPVFGAEGDVRVVANHRGAVAISGGIVDPRHEYEGVDEPVSADLAKTAMLEHAAMLLGKSIVELSASDPELVAVPRSRRMGWFAEIYRGGFGVGGVLVSATVGNAGSLELLSFDRRTHYGLGDTTPITVRAEDPGSDVITDPLTQIDVDTLPVSGGALLGSIDDHTGDPQLATERVFTFDMLDNPLDPVGIVAAQRIVSASGQFLDGAGVTFDAQKAYFAAQSIYEVMDSRMAGQWESLLGAQSSFPPGQFEPRILLAIDVDATCQNQPACVIPLVPGAIPGGVEQEFEQRHMGVGNTETLGSVLFRNSAVGTPVIAHEFAHILDLFTGAGFTVVDPACGGSCTASCVEDTTDESAPLTETIGSTFALWFLNDIHEIDFDTCTMISVGASSAGGEPVHSASCMSDNQVPEVLARDDSPECTVGNANCDKPDAEGWRCGCCDPAADPDCCDPNDAGCSGTNPEPSCASGICKFLPTGLCSPTQGYDTSSVFQAVWELLHGQSCAEAFPFTCQAVPGLADIAPDALVHALRLNSATYQQFFDNVAQYISCNEPGLYAQFNEIVCHHGLRQCGAPPPMICEDCGNGVREGSEECDDLDLAMCAEGADGGSSGGGSGVSCNAMCMCEFPSGTTGGSSSGGVGTSGIGSGSGTGGGAVDPGGCGCRSKGADPPLWGMLGLFLFVIRRRRGAFESENQ